MSEDAAVESLLARFMRVRCYVCGFWPGHMRVRVRHSCVDMFVYSFVFVCVCALLVVCSCCVLPLLRVMCCASVGLRMRVRVRVRVRDFSRGFLLHASSRCRGSTLCNRALFCRVLFERVLSRSCTSEPCSVQAGFCDT